jgi:serine/threonine protein phosphatase PrpC
MTPSLTEPEAPSTTPHDTGSCGGRPRPLTVRSHGRTDKGRTRTSNEDQFLIAVLTKALQVLQTSLRQEDVQFGGTQGYLFLVADGVGGNAAGEQASALAVDTIEHFVVDTLNWCIRLRGREEGAGLLDEFRKALQQADARLFREADRHPELRGMGTTLTLAYALDRDLFVAHAGDSRCYLLRSGLLYRLTRDHTLVAEMVRRGLIPPEEAAHHSFRHVITNVVGGSDPGVQVDVHKLPLETGDRLLLCSDGLTEMVSDEEVLTVLQAEGDPAAACGRLIDRANEQGGKDNITVVVAHFEG